MKQIEGGVNAAKGFLACGTAAGLKYKDRKDMALVYSETPAVSAGVFTKNVVKAAPVLWDIRLVREQNTARAVVLNSGIANACTGKEGEETNRFMAESIAKPLGIKAEEVLTASTGVIGRQLPMDKLKAGAEELAGKLSAGNEGGHDAAVAIMTTDTVCKEYALQFEMGGSLVTLGGMTKGSGMIHPDMATMLCVLTTDAAISKEMLQEALSENVKDTFNMISVDRDTSTNDTYLILANGEAGNPEVTKKDADYRAFTAALSEAGTYLAKKMAGDGEGATKLFEVRVKGCRDKEQAVLLSKSVITSNLVKTAVYGNDANWGRILCAMGYSGAQFDPDKVDLYIESRAGKLKIVEDGVAADYSEEKATEILGGEEVTATADIKEGQAEATAWGCDLTYDYVKINGDYRS